jgi:hypothetical protein
MKAESQSDALSYAEVDEKRMKCRTMGREARERAKNREARK